MLQSVQTVSGSIPRLPLQSTNRDASCSTDRQFEIASPGLHLRSVCVRSARSG